MSPATWLVSIEKATGEDSLHVKLDPVIVLSVELSASISSVI
jgi:hypothetical protein